MCDLLRKLQSDYLTQEASRLTRLQFRDNRMVPPLTSRHMQSSETERAYRRFVFDAICVAVLIAYFLHFAFPALRGGFREDEMMNMGICWCEP